MDYLTQYYKNLAEQLEERINHLTQLIENQTLTPDNHDGPDAGSKGSAILFTTKMKVCKFFSIPTSKYITNCAKIC